MGDRQVLTVWEGGKEASFGRAPAAAAGHERAKWFLPKIPGTGASPFSPPKDKVAGPKLLAVNHLSASKLF